MKKLTIRLEDPLDRKYHEYISQPLPSHMAEGVTEYLNGALPILLEDSLALFTDVKVFTEEVK